MSNRFGNEEAQTKAAKLEAEKYDATTRGEINSLMGTVEGRKFILDLIFAKCGVLRASFVQKDSMASAFNEGMRNVGLDLLAMVDRYAPDLFLLARREQLDRIQPVDNLNKPTQEKTNG